MAISDNEVVTFYEVHGLTPEQIAEELDYDIIAVKTCLERCSSKFRKAMNKAEKPWLSDEEREAIRQTMVNIALYSENDAVKLKAGIYCNEEATGRNEARAKKVNAPPINVVLFNEARRLALEAMSGITTTIEVPAEVKREATA